MITFNEFKKLDIRVAEIKDIEEISGADKLWKIKIDIGEEKIIVAGIKQQYSKEKLIGKQIIVVNNIEPSVIKGVESKAMLLAAEDGNIISLLIPDKKVKIGSKIH